LTALEQVTHEPDLIFCDGQGIAHPRGLGLAAHLGILLEKPTIGCAKRRLVGVFGEVGPKRGDYAILRYKDRQVGAVLRTRSEAKPVFVSPGYGISIRSAVRMTIQCGGGYRIPEPTRQAHLLVNKIRKQSENRVS
jgi:deoxyribonuclease V